MRARLTAALLAALAACDRPAGDEPAEDARLRYSAPDPEESRPIPRGFTHRPPPGTPGLPPPAPPLLPEDELEAARLARGRTSPEARERARREVLALVEELERSAAPGDVLGRLRTAVVDGLRQGLLAYLTADALHERYRFPNEEEAQAELGGKLVVLTGTVAPHSMLDPADGFKVFDRTPYVHQPVLLATVHELSFLRCVLARPEAQKLRDWEEVHLVGVVAGKERSDVILRRCVVLEQGAEKHGRTLRERSEPGANAP